MRRIVLFDGECRMCSGWARFVEARDARREIELLPLQSDEGRALLETHGLPADEMSTIVYVEGGSAFTKSSAVLRIVRRLKWPWPAVAVLRVVPRAVRDALYDVVARHRRRIFGAQKCELPRRPPPR